jgi:hypothetical protein
MRTDIFGTPLLVGMAMLWAACMCGSNLVVAAGQNGPGEQVLPEPRTVNGAPGWSFDPVSGVWRHPQGTIWRFDGLQWRVLWEDNHWYPVLPPIPLPSCWQRVDFGEGWGGVLHSTKWHVIPPSYIDMPPPAWHDFAFPLSCPLPAHP